MQRRERLLRTHRPSLPDTGCATWCVSVGRVARWRPSATLIADVHGLAPVHRVGLWQRFHDHQVVNGLGERLKPARQLRLMVLDVFNPHPRGVRDHRLEGQVTRADARPDPLGQRRRRDGVVLDASSAPCSIDTSGRSREPTDRPHAVIVSRHPSSASLPALRLSASTSATVRSAENLKPFGRHAECQKVDVRGRVVQVREHARRAHLLTEHSIVAADSAGGPC